MNVNAPPCPLHPRIAEITARIEERSAATRADYLNRMAAQAGTGRQRAGLGCANMAHTTAALGRQDKLRIQAEHIAHVGIVSAYNDMLSAHQPYEAYPELLRTHARALGASAQLAGGVPAMCDGITQGESGMELSLFSREVIALATATALSHKVFDATLLLGVCDKIVPGLFMGAASFGHLSTAFVPAGPMTSGLSNSQKAKIRQQYSLGQVGRQALLEAETQAYHSSGTCTFYGTANSNQMLMEIMGLHLPGASFVPPGTALREALTRATLEAALIGAGHDCPSTSLPPATDPGAKAARRSLAKMVDEKTWVNAIIGLLATGGSTNHTLHLVAMARTMGVLLRWQDFAELSAVIPLLTRIYPNGEADVNHFHAAGGMGVLIAGLLRHGLLHADAQTILGSGIEHYAQEPWLDDGRLAWRPSPAHSADQSVLRGPENPFSADGGLRVLHGNLGQSIIKVSAVAKENRCIHAPALVLQTQQELAQLHQAGQLQRDFIAVLPYQGPRARGMPELHKLTPILGALQDQGFRVGLITDGRMSGASGKVPAAIHLSPEAINGGAIARIQSGDMLLLDSERGLLEVQVDATTFAQRKSTTPDLTEAQSGNGRELFTLLRRTAGPAEEGASALFVEP